jgi:23S rRNA pseudouridine2605 synthase
LRLQKFIALCGVASRRKAEELISSGRVSVDGTVITEMGHKVESWNVVSVNGKVIEPEVQKVYIALNKPTGYITTASDQFGRKTVLDLMQKVPERIFPVGRLDADTSGLLILTNDGDFAYRLTHPKHTLAKTYLAFVEGLPDAEKIKEFESGLEIDGYITKPAQFEILKRLQTTSQVRITLYEGRNRQIRKMMEAIGCPVISLKRTAIGDVKLGKLEDGEWRNLTEAEIGKFN